jgi:CrcB protein
MEQWVRILAMQQVVWVFVGGAFGALARFYMGSFIGSRGSALPWGTWVINVTGSFGLGVLTGLSQHLGQVWELLIGTGFIGAYTTFSTLSYETLRLLEQGEIVAGVLNPVASLLVGLLLAGIGVATGQALA